MYLNAIQTKDKNTMTHPNMTTSSLRMVMLFVCISVINLIVVSSASGVEGLVNPKNEAKEITVGGPKADIPGFTTRAIQIALDALQIKGGGTVRLGPGQYEIDAPIKLYDNINLVGSGSSTVLHKIDAIKTNFVIDGDYGMFKVTVKDASGFKPGMGILLYDTVHNDCWDHTTARITHIDGNVIYFDNKLIRDYYASADGTVITSGSIIEGNEVENVRIADLVVDGNKSNNEKISGCIGGGVYLYRSRNVLIENVVVRNFNGDSFSWQTTENITVHGCEAEYGTGLGFHPGTGSDTSIIENCHSHHNDADGIFLCWRVQNGTFSNNNIHDNGRFGISIGHKDTDNIFENNHIHENTQHGVNFRDESEENGGHRNTFRNNTIENNGSPGFKAYGFYIGGVTHDITIDSNTIRSTGKGNQVGAIFIGENASGITEKNNTVTGHPGIIKQKQ